jgi:hypothetical protein
MQVLKILTVTCSNITVSIIHVCKNHKCPERCMPFPIPFLLSETAPFYPVTQHTLPSWRWRRVPLTHWYLPTTPHDITSQKAVLIIFTAARFSNFT